MIKKLKCLNQTFSAVCHHQGDDDDDDGKTAENVWFKHLVFNHFLTF